jgi:hypothetical protein
MYKYHHAIIQSYHLMMHCMGIAISQLRVSSLQLLPRLLLQLRSSWEQLIITYITEERSVKQNDGDERYDTVK